MNTPRTKTPAAPAKKRKTPMHVSDAMLARAIKDCTGNIAQVAAKVGVDRATVSRRILGSPYLKETREKVVIEVTAVAEANVVDAIYEGDLHSSKWWLDRTKFREDQGSYLLPPPPIGDAPCLVKT